MPSPSPSPIADRQTCITGRLCAEFKRLALLAIVLGLIFIAGKYYCFDRLNEEIRSRVESLLRNHYAGLNVTVKSARRVAGHGVEIRGIRIAEGGKKSAPFLAEIDEIFARCDTRLPDFLTKPPQISDLKIHRLKLRAERKPSGRWNLAHLLPLPTCDSAAPPLATISDATLEIIDPAQHPAGGLMLRNIELSVEPAAAAPGQAMVLHVHGTLGGDHFERVEIDGSLDPVTSRWDLRGAVEGLEFSPRLRAGLPHELSEVLAPLSSIRGRTFFGFHASRGPRRPGTRDPSPLEFVIHGKISEGRIDDARLPEPLTDVEATMRFDNHGLSIEGLSARCGPTQIELNAPLLSYSGQEPADIELRVRQLQLEQLPTHSMPPALLATWDRFRPRGMADLTGRLRFDGHQWLPELKIDCRELSLAYDRFPYRLSDGSGTIELKPSGISVRLKLLGGGRTVACRAEVQNPGLNFTGWVQVQSDGSIAIDENVLSAIELPAQKVVRAFGPRGGVSFFARFSRDPGESALRRHVEINLHDCTIQHERFKYPIDRVGGTLVLDGESWTFMNLTGRNDSAEISGQGVWATEGAAGRQLKLQFVARDVPLAEELRQALPPSAQRLWANLRPRGNLDQVAVNLRYGAASQSWSIDIGAQKGPATISGEGRSISLEPAWFRYALNDVSGALRYRDGRMELSNMRATHGQAAIAAEGNCSILPAGGCRLQLTSLAADRVVVDQELLAALPAGLGQSLDRLPLEGPVNVLGKLAIDVPAEPTARPLLSWDLDLDVENGRLLTSTPVEHLHGGLSLSGRQTSEGVFARGELKVDSAIIRGLQLTNVTGPYWFDGRQLVFGALADRGTQQGAPRQVTASVLGGLLSLDGTMQLLGDRPFDLQASLANADLAEIVRQVAREQHPPSGKVFGLVHLAGNSQGTHTWQGEGKINLREADLYELPSMVQLLKLLSIQRPNRTAFTNSNIDFRIEGDDLAFDRIDFSGDAISLKGKGRMNRQRQIDLKFYPLVGREERQLAIFRPFLGQTAQEFMLIEVTGTLDQPEIIRTPFPRLEPRLQQLFPELVRDETIEPKAPSNSSPWNALNRLRQNPQR